MCQTPSIPRKGTETETSCSLNSMFWRVRHPQFPARGRKRMDAEGWAWVGESSSDTLNSPQGDGNSDLSDSDLEGAIRVRHPQFPARGRKRTIDQRMATATYTCQTPSIPRKGTETPFHHLFVQELAVFGQTPSIPRKGTETCRLSYRSLSLSVNQSDTLNSPQGDGNSLAYTSNSYS